MSSPQSSACRLDELSDLTSLIATMASPDPAKVYDKLRDNWGSVAPVELAPGVPAWLVMSYRGICTMSRQEQLFSRDPVNWRLLQDGHVKPDSGLAPIMARRPNAYFTDGEEHRRLRLPLEDGIKGLDEQRTARIVREICNRLIDRMPEHGEIDLVAHYAVQVPMLTVAALVGFDTDLSEELQACMLAMFSAGEGAQEGDRRLSAIITNILNERRMSPANDLATAFLVHPSFKRGEELHASMVLMMAAGWEASQVLICQMIKVMLTDRQFAARLRGGQLGIEEALGDVLWSKPPMAHMPVRYAIMDAALEGREIARGDALVMGYQAANNDPSIGARDRFTDSGNRAHLSWGVGAHRCPAQRIAHIIAAIAVETIFHRLPGARLAIPADAIPVQPTPWSCGPARLPVIASRTQAMRVG
jgi:cytochrome P450